jgi:hypothetical protein
MNDDLVAMLERERITRPRQAPTPQRIKDLTAEAERYLMLQETETAGARRRHRRSD